MPLSIKWSVKFPYLAGTSRGHETRETGIEVIIEIGTEKGIEITGTGIEKETEIETEIGTGIETGTGIEAAMPTMMVVPGPGITEIEIAIGIGIDGIAGLTLYRNEATTSITRLVVLRTSVTTETVNGSNRFLNFALRRSYDEAAQGNDLTKEIGAAVVAEALALVKMETIMEAKTR